MVLRVVIPPPLLSVERLGGAWNGWVLWASGLRLQGLGWLEASGRGVGKRTARNHAVEFACLSFGASDQELQPSEVQVVKSCRTWPQG